jgi:hypothetical protein
MSAAPTPVEPPRDDEGGGGYQAAAAGGIGFGSCLAMVISWSLHQSVLWAILHGLMGWIYVVYYLLTRGS